MIPLLLGFAAACALTDLRSRRIPNWLTVAGALSGFGLHAWQTGWAGLAFAGQGFAAAFGIYAVLFLLRGRGAGDLKMMAALGAIIGWSNWLLLFVLSAVIGGLVALIVIVARGRVGQTIRNLRRLPEQKLGQPGSLALPHAPVVAVAAVFTAIAMHGQ
jgi:prepilin peptidase CpaA